MAEWSIAPVLKTGGSQGPVSSNLTASARAGWRNAKHAQQWRNTLDTYAYPLIGDLLVRDIGLPHVLAVLEPIWTKKTETASRLRGECGPSQCIARR